MPVTLRGDEEWRDLLGDEHFAYWNHLASRSPDAAEIATRLWCVRESLIKLGNRLPALLRISVELPDGWIEFSAHNCRIQTCVIISEGEPSPLVFAVAH
jgi:enediyne polyketide synthase